MRIQIDNICGTEHVLLISAFPVKALLLCRPPRSPAGLMMNSSFFPIQVPLAHNIFGLIGPNAGLGFAIGKKSLKGNKKSLNVGFEVDPRRSVERPKDRKAAGTGGESWACSPTWNGCCAEGAD